MAPRLGRMAGWAKYLSRVARFETEPCHPTCGANHRFKPCGSAVDPLFIRRATERLTRLAAVVARSDWKEISAANRATLIDSGGMSHTHEAGSCGVGQPRRADSTQLPSRDNPARIVRLHADVRVVSACLGGRKEDQRGVQTGGFVDSPQQFLPMWCPCQATSTAKSDR